MATLTNSAALTYLRNKYEPKLLETAKPLCVFAQFGQKGKIGTGENALGVTWFRQAVADSSRVSTIGTEGTAPSAADIPILETVSATLAQYGEWSPITDIAGWTAMWNLLDHHTQIMGGDAALHHDNIIRNTLVSGLTGTGERRYAGGAADHAALRALTADQGRFTRVDGLAAATALGINKAPRINGGYVCIVPEQVAFDLQQDPDWIYASAYAKPEQLLNGELGMLDGVRYVRSTEPFIEAGTQGTYSGSGNVYRSFCTGAGGYGVVDLSASPIAKPKIIIAKGADKSDPLDQKMTVGWKAFWTAKVLNTAWVRSISSRTTFA